MADRIATETIAVNGEKLSSTSEPCLSEHSSLLLEQSRARPKCGVEFNHCRYWILFISIASMTFIFGNIMAFNFTIICMIGPEGKNGTAEGASSSPSDKINTELYYYDYDYTSMEKNLLFSAVALGCLVTSPLVTFFISRFGFKKTYLGYGWISTASTLLIPLNARIGFWPLFIVRTVQGSGMSPLLSIIGSVSEEWAPVAVVGSYILFLSAPFQLGPIIAMPVSSFFCTSRSFGWPFVYYIQGGITVVLLTLFHLFFWEKPDSRKSWASEKELTLIRKDRPPNSTTSAKTDTKEKVPYQAIFSDTIVWITLLTFFADEVGYTALSQYGPIYLNKAVGVEVGDTGWAAALPHLVSLGTKVVVGQVNDRLTFINDRRRTKIWALVSTSGSILCFASLATLPLLGGEEGGGAGAVPKWLMQVCFTSVNMFTSLAFLGILKSSLMVGLRLNTQHSSFLSNISQLVLRFLEISRRFSHVLMTCEVVISSGVMLFFPLAVSFLAPGLTIQEWGRIFLGIACLQLITITFFVMTCNSKPREWAHSTGLDGIDNGKQSVAKRILLPSRNSGIMLPD